MAQQNENAGTTQYTDTLPYDSTVPHPPSDAHTEKATLWRTAMYFTLIGLIFSTISLNFLGLNYLLPSIGLVLQWLGFRMLRHENIWFQYCWLLTILRTCMFAMTLIINATIWQQTIYQMPVFQALSLLNTALTCFLLFCFQRGLRAVQTTVAFSPQNNSGMFLLIWYGVLCLLALIQYNGLILPLMLFIAYIRIFQNLFRLSDQLYEAGYIIQDAPVRFSNRVLVGSLTFIVLLGISCGYLFFHQYPMAWTPVSHAEQMERKNDEAYLRLKQLGIPEDILADLTVEDLAACKDAIAIYVEEDSYPANDGYTVTNGSNISTEYNIKELHCTNIAVKLPDKQNHPYWRVIHHFCWTINPGFYGTEAIQAWPTYHDSDNWLKKGPFTGQILYNKNSQTYKAPYYSITEETYQSDTIFWGIQNSTDIFASFSFPKNGELCRGYLTYDTLALKEDALLNSWVNYVHQESSPYPSQTAAEFKMTSGLFNSDTFRTTQDALQIIISDTGAKGF